MLSLPGRRSTSPTQPRRTLAALAFCVAAAGIAGGALAGCSSGGSGGGSSSGAGASTSPQSTVSNNHWKTALSALGQSYQPAPLALDDTGLRRWSALLERSWPRFRTMIEPTLEQALRSAIQQGVSGALTIGQVKNFHLDVAASPWFTGSPAGSELMIELPGNGARWGVGFTVEVGTSVQSSVVGVPFTAGVTLDVDVRVHDIRVVQQVGFDLSNPTRPQPVSAAAPQISLQLDLSSTSPLLSQVVGPLNQVLDPIARLGLGLGAQQVQQELAGLLAQVPTQPPGLGGPGLSPLATPSPLGPVAEDISDEIQAHHLPFGTLLTVHFDQPGYGNGNVVRYRDWGDSAIWTGHYITGEILREELTGDARAFAGAAKALDGLRKCLDVPGQGGLLGRHVVPVGSTHAAGHTGPIGYADGVAYHTEGHISRDQYIGAMLSFITTYQRNPQLRAKAAGLVERVIDYLDRNDWVAYDLDLVTVSAPFTQTPSVLWSFIACGNLANRARWAALHDNHAAMTSILWFHNWTSTREVMESYYKFNLAHSNTAILVSLETDAGRYRDYVKSLEIGHDVVGHHNNAWFDVIWGAAVPSQSGLIGPLVKTELKLWTQRDRRSHPTNNSNDPNVQKTFYTSPFLIGGLQNGQTNPGFWVSTYPLPIGKRVHGDFIWQTQPFQLDGGQTDPTQQHAGVDLILPYWMARSYGMIR
jgi:hypothetical protein